MCGACFAAIGPRRMCEFFVYQLDMCAICSDLIVMWTLLNIIKLVTCKGCVG
jgi:hypothetical protein